MNVGIAVAAQEALTIVYFPLWWYTHGLVRWGKVCVRIIASANAKFAFSIWVKNIFTPMYGQGDFAGRVISIIVRLGNIIVRGIVLCMACLIALLLCIAYLALPPVVVAEIFYFI